MLCVKGMLHAVLGWPKLINITSNMQLSIGEYTRLFKKCNLNLFDACGCDIFEIFFFVYEKFKAYLISYDGVTASSLKRLLYVFND